MSTDLQLMQQPGRESSGMPNNACLPHAHRVRPALLIMPSCLQSMQQVSAPTRQAKTRFIPAWAAVQTQIDHVLSLANTAALSPPARRAESRTPAAATTAVPGGTR
eukprot:CAMPEP_0204200596 /NCGR_PEP_ID=MMETSP0361-20130328/66846_1 /ASSEMBLY_ACC=CAM_ASM_000343 /TAXON_ID=268821 /ORGANISM="Scrippsiella Hangoei, Strain SHTV-5" /LENGTH=105 /DNA_ID=CAMNT_0051163065 /DNA_START=122 /DNA_END=435 /DNA_ORIENTATION=+